ncbi:TlyA family rRNA (cytidine-2'-O)-methyltransferase [Methylopila jiangsuensis]|uniref:TlyA family rRNA (Cytidine-2'-O)-methyltransferase n=1 Tax=Methylopila jiangsuensis TaxID=586230 RepID=A0A9W6N4J4_9HYPH|nr:TlyA family RNA methyltransferase [Methylopila jiangsuensis]MDR6284411.1 23S rRNA (cytidine1920-2'-O)/16S rRNA (cytidine1409-2'-O)-methyltransferase [Methylopila jiangsuensis]GLK78204.1 TlyA family rRNA (cytidine-2'-O)-methyltransferase [Methylopila jiangsuensis]
MSQPTPSLRRRADQLLVERGLFESRAKAQAAIAAGGVTADGRTVARASDMVAPDATISAVPAHPYVSRGGVKLAHALDVFSIDVAGRHALDVGASTGGFSQVLLERGAAHVTAVDVGRDQLHPSLRGHPRLSSLEETDIRALDRGRLPAPPSLVVCDVSFAPLAAVLPAALALARPDATLVALVKPQFEVGKRDIGKNGVVKDAGARERVVEAARALAADMRFAELGVVPSPIAGGDGNVEYLLGARRGNG